MSRWFRNTTPVLLTIAGAAGTIVTAVLAAKAAPQAMELEQKEKSRQGRALTRAERIRAQAPAYGTAALACTGTIACIAGANLLNRRQQASLASAYALLEQSWRKYRGRVRALLGDEAEAHVEADLREEEKEVQEGLPPWDEVQTFYFEPYGKFFERTMEEVVMAEYHINRNLMLKSGVSVNEFLDFLDLPHVKHGDELGWNLWDGEAFYGYQWIDFVHRHYMTEDGLMVCALDTPFPPHYEETEFSGEQGYDPENPIDGAKKTAADMEVEAHER